MSGQILRRIAAFSLVLGALIAPSVATAATPRGGFFSGDEVSFHVDLSEGAVVHTAKYKHHGDFPNARVHEGRFQTCKREPIHRILMREICIAGHFDAEDRAVGTVKAYSGAHGYLSTIPYEVHHFTATAG